MFFHFFSYICITNVQYKFQIYFFKMPLHKTTPAEIIKNSIKVFRRKGYYRTNMSDLAKETGLTKGVFYHHFESKEDVMLKALQATTLWFENKIFSIAFDEKITHKDRLNKMAETTFKAFTDDDGGCFFANTILETANVEDTFLGEIRKFFTAWETAFNKVFENKLQENINNNNNDNDLVVQIIADIEGSIVLMQLYRDKTYLKKALKRSIDKL